MLLVDAGADGRRPDTCTSRSPRGSSRSRTPASSSARPRRGRIPRLRKCGDAASARRDRGQDPAVPGVFYFAGAAAYNPTENTGRVFIQLKPHDERDVTSDQVIQRLRPKVAQVEGAKFFMQSGQDISVGGRLSRTQYQYTLTDTDSDELNHWAPIVEAAMQKLPELQDVASDQQIAAPLYRRSRSIATPPRASGSRCRWSTRRCTTRSASGRSRRCTPRPTSTRSSSASNPSSRTTRPRCRRSMSPAANGVQVPLSAIAHFTTQVEPLMISHQGQFPAVTLSFNLAPGVAIGQAVDKIQATGARAAACRRPSAARSRAPRRRSRPRCNRRRCSSRPRSWSSTSCWACCTRAISTRSRSCRRCPRPASARCWR